MKERIVEYNVFNKVYYLQAFDIDPNEDLELIESFKEQLEAVPMEINPEGRPLRPQEIENSKYFKVASKFLLDNYLKTNLTPQAEITSEFKSEASLDILTQIKHGDKNVSIDLTNTISFLPLRDLLRKELNFRYSHKEPKADFYAAGLLNYNVFYFDPYLPHTIYILGGAAREVIEKDGFSEKEHQNLALPRGKDSQRFFAEVANCLDLNYYSPTIEYDQIVEGVKEIFFNGEEPFEEESPEQKKLVQDILEQVKRKSKVKNTTKEQETLQF